MLCGAAYKKALFRPAADPAPVLKKAEKPHH